MTASTLPHPFHPVAAAYPDGILLGHQYEQNPPERWLYLTLPSDDTSLSRGQYEERVHQTLNHLRPEGSDGERSVHLLWTQWQESSFTRRVAFIGVRLNPDTDISGSGVVEQWVATLRPERYEADELKVRSALTAIGCQMMDSVERSKLLSWTSQDEGDLTPLIAGHEYMVEVNSQYQYRLAMTRSASQPGLDTWMATAFNRGVNGAAAMSLKTVFGQANSQSVEIIAAVPMGDDSVLRTPFTQTFSGLEWSPMIGRQTEGLIAMWPCSPVAG